MPVPPALGTMARTSRGAPLAARASIATPSLTAARSESACGRVGAAPPGGGDELDDGADEEQAAASASMTTGKLGYPLASVLMRNMVESPARVKTTTHPAADHLTARTGSALDLHAVVTHFFQV
jgi:hypothetical protein